MKKFKEIFEGLNSAYGQYIPSNIYSTNGKQKGKPFTVKKQVTDALWQSHLDGKDGPFTPPPFSHIYKLSSVKNTGKGNEWYGYNIQKVGEITDTNLYNRAKSFYESCRRADQSNGKAS